MYIFLDDKVMVWMILRRELLWLNLSLKELFGNVDWVGLGLYFYEECVRYIWDFIDELLKRK